MKKSTKLKKAKNLKEVICLPYFYGNGHVFINPIRTFKGMGKVDDTPFGVTVPVVDRFESDILPDVEVILENFSKWCVGSAAVIEDAATILGDEFKDIFSGSILSYASRNDGKKITCDVVELYPTMAEAIRAVLIQGDGMIIDCNNGSVYSEITRPQKTGTSFQQMSHMGKIFDDIADDLIHLDPSDGSIFIGVKQFNT